MEMLSQYFAAVSGYFTTMQSQLDGIKRTLDALLVETQRGNDKK